MNVLTVSLLLIVLIATINSVQQKFSEAIFKEIILSKTNQLICPISLEVLMALLSMGASNSTLDEIRTVFGFDQEEENTRQFYYFLLNQFNFEPSVYMANKIFIKNDYEVSYDFKNIAVSDFLSDIENVDFSKSEETADLINDWIQNKTLGRIKDLVQPSDLDPDTLMVLVNTLYFRQSWFTKFDESKTKKLPFYQSDGSVTDVDMMNHVHSYPYAYFKDLDAQVLELPYYEDGYSMVIVLPKHNNFTLLEDNIPKILNAKLFPSVVNVTLPKFRIESSIDFQPILEKFGMTEIFTNRAQLSGILKGDHPLKISKIFQKTFIEVSENGTEAAGATTIRLMTLYNPAGSRKYFKADRPFLFFILKRMNRNIVLFAGLLSSINK